eukprot:4309285-Prymnesium_polylepis.1
MGGSGMGAAGLHRLARRLAKFLEAAAPGVGKARKSRARPADAGGAGRPERRGVAAGLHGGAHSGRRRRAGAAGWRRAGAPTPQRGRVPTRGRYGGALAARPAGWLDSPLHRGRAGDRQASERAHPGVQGALAGLRGRRTGGHLAAERRHPLHRRRRATGGGTGAWATGGHDAGSGAV